MKDGVMNLQLIFNSLVVALGATFVAAIIGFSAALGISTLPRKARFVAIMAGFIILALPPFLIASVWLQLTGASGPWNADAPFSLYSKSGAGLLLAIWLWPIPCLVLLSSWSSLNRPMLEQETALRDFKLISSLLLPLSWPTLRATLILLTILTMNQFSIPAILQVKVLPSEAWINFSAGFDVWQALAISWPLAVIPILMFRFLPKRQLAWPSGFNDQTLNLIGSRMGSGSSVGALIVTVAAVSCSLIVPVIALVAGTGGWSGLLGAAKSSTSSILQSGLQAASVATLSLLLGFHAKVQRLQAAWLLLFLAPGFLIGLALIFVFNRQGLEIFYPSIGLVVIALLVKYLAWPSALVPAARQSVTRSLSEAAMLDGASGWHRLSQVEWPQIRARCAACWMLVYLLTLWDVETSVLIVPPGGETLALRAFHLLHYGHNSQVNALCLILLILAALPFLAWAGFRAAAQVAASVRSREVIMMAASLTSFSLFTGCSGPAPHDQIGANSLFSKVEVIGQRGTGPGRFNKPRSLALDKQDNLYVVDMTGRVQKFDNDGRFLLFWEMEKSEKGKPKGMIGAADGNGVWVVEPHYSRVTHFSASGKPLLTWGKDGTNSGELAFPRAIALGTSNELILAEYSRVERIQKFSPDGSNWLSTWGQPGTAPGEFNRAEGIGVGPDGSLYVADSCNHRIQQLDASGHPLKTIGSPGSAPGQLSYPYDVRADSSGLIFVCEFGNSRVQVFDTSGQSREVIGGMGSRPGEMNNPWAIAIDSKGNLFVADSLNHRVLKFHRRTSAQARVGMAEPPRERIGRAA